MSYQHVRNTLRGLMLSGIAWRKMNVSELGAEVEQAERTLDAVLEPLKTLLDAPLPVKAPDIAPKAPAASNGQPRPLQRATNVPPRG